MSCDIINIKRINLLNALIRIEFIMVTTPRPLDARWTTNPGIDGYRVIE